MLAILGGCAGSGKAVNPAHSVQVPERVWPSPPEQPRIALEQVVLRPSDLGIKRSAVIRFGQWLTGSEKGNEPLIKPFGVALDETGNLCITDTGAGAVCFYDKPKKKWHRWEKIGKTRFISPVAVAKQNSTLYVADSTLGRVIAFTTDGRLVFSTTNGLARPTGIAVVQGRIFVTDSQQHCIVVLDVTGNKLTAIGKRGTAPGEFNFPTHISADSQGALYITDSMNGRVQVLTTEGQLLRHLGELGDGPGHFSRPKGVAVDGSGNVYAIDALFDNVQLFDKNGRLLMHFAGPGSGPGELWLPNGIAVSPGNNIYIADSYNRRIQVFKYLGPS